MPRSQSILFQVRLTESEKRRIKTLAASQGLTFRQATVRAYEAWASQLQSQARAADPALGVSAGAQLEKPGKRNRGSQDPEANPSTGSGQAPSTSSGQALGHKMTPRQDLNPADARRAPTPGGQPADGVAPSAEWLRRAMRLDWSKCPAVESAATKSGRVWLVRWTRVPLAYIFKALAEEHPLEEIAVVYEIGEGQLKAILQFAIEGVALTAAER